MRSEMEFPGSVLEDASPSRRHRRMLKKLGLLMVLAPVCSLMARAQVAPDPADAPASTSSPKAAAKAPESPEDSPDLKLLPRYLFLDQKDFWSTPFHLTKSQWRWTVPLSFAGAGLLAIDTAAESHVPKSASTVSRSSTASNAGVAALVAGGGGMFLWGHLTHDDQARETGLLGGEAAIDAFLDTTAFKYATGRDRPFTG